MTPSIEGVSKKENAYDYVSCEELWVEHTGASRGAREANLIRLLTREWKPGLEALNASWRWHGGLENHAFDLLARSEVLHMNPLLRSSETVPGS